jgi:flagellar L-ring protein precursor FlgH
MNRRLSFLAKVSVMVFSTIYFKLGVCQQLSAPSLFADHRANRVGDIVTILIVEYSSASSQANSKTSKNSDHSISSTGGSGSQSYMPLYGLRGQLKNGFDNEAATSRKGSLTGKITASITEVTANGNLIVKGDREVMVNGEKEMITISGVVRPEDIGGDNTVYSFNMADAKITYQGKGLVDRGQKPGIIDRLLGWIF